MCKRLFTGVFAVFFVFSFFLTAHVHAAKDLKYSLDLRPEFNIPKAETPPEIDGRMREGEWKDALIIRGMSGPHSPQYFGRESIFYLMWDEEKLYIGHRSSIREGERLAKQKREKRAMGVVYDDSCEFGVDVSEIHQPEDQAEFFYKFILNPLGAGEYQKIYPSIGQSIYNWMPELEMGNEIWEADSGRRYWDMEIAMDVDDMELPRELKAGDQIRLNLARNFKWPWEFSNVPTPSGYLVSRGFPLATLVEEKPAVQIRKLDGLLDRGVDLDMKVINPSETSTKVDVEVEVTGRKNPKQPGEEVYFTEQKTPELPSDGAREFSVERSLDSKDGFVNIRVRESGQPEDEPIYKYDLSFAEDTEKKFMEYTRTPPAFPLSVRYNPVRRKLWIEGDTLDAEIEEGADPTAMTYAIIPEDGDAPVEEDRIERYAHNKYQDVVELPDLAPGTYRVHCELLNDEDEVLIEDDRSFEVTDPAEKFAEWWDNDIGSSDQLLRPFEPLDVDMVDGRRIISPVLRRYEMDALGLPRTISSNGGEVLADPVRLVVVVDGVEHTVDLDGTVKIEDAQQYRVSFRGSAEAAGLDFHTTGTVEQDGLVDIELTYSPANGPVEIEHLRSEWPLVRVSGERINSGNSMVVIGSGGNYAVRKIGQVPEGQGVVWDTLNDLGVQGSAMTKGNYYGNVWVGTERRGLLWAGDSDGGWVPRHDYPAHSIAREDDAVVIRNHIIGTPDEDDGYVLEHDRTVRFQYNASPFKPLDPGFRVNLRSAGNGFGGQEGYMGNEEENIDGWTLLHPPTKDTEKWPDWYDRWSEHAEKYNRQALYDVGRRQKIWNNTQIALRGYGPKSIEPGIYSYFSTDWNPVGGTGGGELLVKSYRDYMHHLQERMVKEAGMRQFYYDIAFASYINHNLTNDTGYFLDDGRIQPQANDDEVRAYARRTYAMMQENGVYPTGVTGHATNAFCLKALPYFDAMLDAEYPAENPINTFSSERMIAMSVPHAFGSGINHLGQGMNLRWAALHDASPSGASTFRKITFDNPALKHWGITLDDVEFIPYWRNENVVRDIGEGLLASIWK
ncbi:MAG: glycoside hydrolase domain-containing protein, partial [Planctomycetota bacterium]